MISSYNVSSFMSVNTYDPNAAAQPIDSELVQQLCVLATGLDSDVLALNDAEVARFSALASHADWSATADALSDAEISALIRVFTLGEMEYSSWTAGEKSPVVSLVKVLKQRGAYDAEFTRWIKARTTNKFLPHGSLLDRL
jgi:hypothetical protein